jgi:hypothetical protein
MTRNKRRSSTASKEAKSDAKKKKALISEDFVRERLKTYVSQEVAQPIEWDSFQKKKSENRSLFGNLDEFPGSIRPSKLGLSLKLRSILGLVSTFLLISRTGTHFEIGQFQTRNLISKCMPNSPLSLNWRTGITLKLGVNWKVGMISRTGIVLEIPLNSKNGTCLVSRVASAAHRTSFKIVPFPSCLLITISCRPPAVPERLCTPERRPTASA